MTNVVSFHMLFGYLDILLGVVPVHVSCSFSIELLYIILFIYSIPYIFWVEVLH